MNLFKHLPRLAAAAAFAASTATAVVVGQATHAGQPASGLLAAAPQAASAYVSVGVGINFGGPSYRYPRYAFRGGVWVPYGYGYAAAPGYFNGYYVGYRVPYGYYPPGYARPVYARAYYGGGYRGYYGHPYYGGGGYRGSYGRAYGHGYYRR